MCATAEFAQVHAEGAVNLPLGDLQSNVPLPGDRSGPVYLLCHSGARAAQAARILAARGGDPTLFVVDGGTQRWLASGLPVVRGPAGAGAWSVRFAWSPGFWFSWA